MSGLFWEKALDTVDRHEMQKRLAMALATGLFEMFSKMMNFVMERFYYFPGKTKTISLSHLKLCVLYCLKQPAAEFHNYADEKSSHLHPFIYGQF